MNRRSAGRLFYVSVYEVVCVLCVGLNTGSYYAVGTLLNTIVLHYFPVRNGFY